MALARWGFATAQHLTVHHDIIHDESDDTVANSMNSGTTEKFYREDSACAAQNRLRTPTRHELASPAALLVLCITCSRGSDDDLCTIGRCTNINPTPHTRQEHPSD